MICLLCVVLDRATRHRACALRDMANAIISTELDPEFDKACQEVVRARQARGGGWRDYH